MCGLYLHRTLTHCQEKREPCFLNDFVSFFSNYIYTFSKIFVMIFYPISYKFDPCFGIFREGQNGTNVYRFFLYKIHLLGRNIPVYLTYVKFIPRPLLYKCCRGTQIISSMNGMHRYENLQPNYEQKSVGKGHLCERVILAGTQE